MMILEKPLGTTIKMYLRYRSKYFKESTQKTELRFFWAANYCLKEVDLLTNEREKLQKLMDWFDNTLPIPDYYQDEKNRRSVKAATSWFKDSAQEFIKAMNEMAVILEKYHVEVERIHAKKMVGRVLYEDEFQVTIMPHRDVKKSVK